MGRGRAGGLVAVTLSALWALASFSVAAFGILLVLSGRKESELDIEGFVEFVGGGLAIAGGIVLVAAVCGIYLGTKLMRGRPRVAFTAILFALFAAVSAAFLSSAIADESGADPGGIVLFGVNTAACIVVVLAAIRAR